jgi:hypothetical protein
MGVRTGDSSKPEKGGAIEEITSESTQAVLK